MLASRHCQYKYLHESTFSDLDCLYPIACKCYLFHEAAWFHNCELWVKQRISPKENNFFSFILWYVVLLPYVAKFSSVLTFVDEGVKISKNSPHITIKADKCALWTNIQSNATQRVLLDMSH